MLYKPSMYNHRLYDLGKLILYNSLSGTKMKVSNIEKAKDIEEILNKKEILDDCTLVKYLFNNGFIVKVNEDEKRKAQLLKLDKIINKNLRLIIMPTEQCNFRCQYCYEGFKLGKMDIKHQNGIIKFIQRNINNYTGIHLDWYGGEPLLALDVIDYISKNVAEICKCAKKPMTSSITTNAFLLNLETYNKLQKYNLVNAQITIDGLKETHDKQRVLANGKPTYDRIIDNLKAIKENTKSAVQRIIIRTNVTYEIYQAFEEYIDFYYDLFGDDKRFSFLIRPVGDWGGDAVHNIEDNIMDRESFSLIYKKIIDMNKLNLSYYENYLNPAGSICYANVRNAFVIRADGRINKCTCALDTEDNDIGVLLENGEMDIDMYKHAKWICGIEKPQCDNCNFYGSCLNSNCPLKNLELNNYFTCGYEGMYLDQTLIMLSRSGIIQETILEG